MQQELPIHTDDFPNGDVSQAKGHDCSSLPLFSLFANVKSPTPEKPITYADLVEASKSPQKTEKHNAACFIPSNARAKTKEAITDKTRFALSVIDIDTDTPLGDIEGGLLEMGIGRALIYSTKSATAQCQKWRVVVPFADEVDIGTWQALTALLCERFGGDTAMLRNTQVSFVPNVGEHYQYHEITQGSPLDVNHPTIVRAIERQREREAIERAIAQEKARDTPPSLAKGQQSPIDAYNRQTSIATLLEQHGYKRKDQKYLCPNSTSGTAGVVILQDETGKERAYSHHSPQSDPLANGMAHDAFSVFCVLEHGDNQDAAIKAAGDVTGVTKANQDAYRENKKTSRKKQHDENEGFCIDDFPPPPFLKEWVYLTASNKFLHVRTKDRVDSKGFDALHNSLFPREVLCETRGSASRYALDIAAAKIKVVSDQRYSPQREQFFSLEGIDYVNAYRLDTVPLASVPDEAGLQAIDTVKTHIAHLLNNRAEQITLFLDWLAYQVQYTGRKVRFAPMIKGIEGDGKSTLGKLIRAVLGPANVRDIDPKAVTSDFNSWATGSAVVCLEEVRVIGHNKYDALNALKPLITNPVVSITCKGVDPVEVENVTNYIAFTNFSDALPIGETDRRWWIIYTPWATLGEMAKKIGCDDLRLYFRTLHKAIDTQVGALRYWLENHKISETFDPDDVAPLTSEKAIMSDAGGSELEDAIKDAMQKGHEYVCADAVSVRHLCDVLSRVLTFDKDAPQFTTRDVSQVLKRLGYQKCAAGAQGKLKIEGRLESVWTRNAHLTRDEIRKAWDNAKASDDLFG